MKFDEFNEAGGAHGRTIKFIVEDHQYTVPRAVQAANKLLKKGGLLAIEIGNRQYLKVAHLLKQNGYREKGKELDYNNNVRCIISTKM